MGISGSGKSHLGNLISHELDAPFIEGDDIHPPSNVQKMSSGIPLNDQDREVWLDAIKTEITNISKSSSSRPYFFITCSALKFQYREFLSKVTNDDLKIWFIYLKASKEVLKQRMLNRQNHFMKENMLESQFETFEEPKDTEEKIIIIDANREDNEIKEDILKKIKVLDL
ncbi:16845_t:CDS:2 [Funneliformis mosseae]|uniref:Gluconokinase n=1 Tax=Funneliformis mosseae TaxID=27381 RepID=A0A9N8ZB01_FUNMO|nr:16845_t:CDS:2 [Funneliformis mosseae]